MEGNSLLVKATRCILEPSLSRRLLGLRFEGYLVDTGWIESHLREAPVDSDGEPLAWLTYPALRFLDSRLSSSMDVFEYGIGYSTRYFSRRVGTVTGVEDSKEWFDRMVAEMLPNVSLTHEADPSSRTYIRAATRAEGGYDLILIDGRNRSACLRAAVGGLKPGGVVIFDDSERARYAKALGDLDDQGFRRIDFSGLAPNITYEKTTSILYRDENCLGI